MRLKFLGKCAVRGGAQFNPGEEAELPEYQAAPFLALGLAHRASEETPPEKPAEKDPPRPPARGVERPPVDKMLRRGDAQRKDGGG